MSFESIHHVGLVVSNLESSLAWYERVLGFQLRSRTEIPESGLKFAYISRGDFELELFEQDGSVEVDRDGRDVFRSFLRQGIPHFAFRSNDLDATYAWAVKEHLSVILPPQINEAMGVRYFFIVDPDGIQIEFVQRLD